MRSAQLEELQTIIDDPFILYQLGLPRGARYDLSGLRERGDVYSFIAKPGAMIFRRIAKGIYDSHFLFYKKYGGAAIKSAAHAMLNEMFTTYGASVIKGFPPRDNRAVRVIGCALGYEKVPNSEHIDELGRECEEYILRREKWETC